MPALLSALSLAAAAACPAPVEIPVFLHDNVWSVDASGEQLIATVADAILARPGAELTLLAKDVHRGEPAVSAVGDVFARRG